MFLFVIRHLGFLKSIPGLGIVFDAWLKVCTLLTNPAVPDHIDAIEAAVTKWSNIDTSIHKYGGLQFNYNKREIGHIHSNGLLDMLLSRKIKQELMKEGRIQHHHSFKNSGWASFYIKTEDDKEYAISLLKLCYDRYLEKQRTVVNAWY